MKSVALFVVISWLTVGGCAGPQKKTQPETYHSTSQSLYWDSIAFYPIGDLTTSIQQKGDYQQTKDYLERAFGPEYLAAWILVIAAGLGIRYTIKTLDLLSISANAAKNAADAASLNAQAVIGAERAWILLEEVRPKMVETVSHYPYRMKVPLSAQFKNYGKTPAWIIESCCKFARTNTADFQGPITYENPVSCSNYPLPPNNGIFPLFPDDQTPLIEMSDIEHVIGGQGALVLYGLVRYRDVFGEKTQLIRETYFCVRLIVSSDRTVEMWQLAGPEKANRCT